MTSGVALVIIQLLTVDADALGKLDRYFAAHPPTCAAALPVPPASVMLALVPLIQAD